MEILLALLRPSYHPNAYERQSTKCCCFLWNCWWSTSRGNCTIWAACLGRRVFRPPWSRWSAGVRWDWSAFSWSIRRCLRLRATRWPWRAMIWRMFSGTDSPPWPVAMGWMERARRMCRFRRGPPSSHRRTKRWTFLGKKRFFQPTSQCTQNNKSTHDIQYEKFCSLSRVPSVQKSHLAVWESKIYCIIPLCWVTLAPPP